MCAFTIRFNYSSSVILYDSIAAAKIVRGEITETFSMIHTKALTMQCEK
jgi:hypothetical protein